MCSLAASYETLGKSPHYNIMMLHITNLDKLHTYITS